MHNSDTTSSNFKFKAQIISLVSALDENDNLESLENSSEDSATDLETDFEKRRDWIPATLACLLKIRFKSHRRQIFFFSFPVWAHFLSRANAQKVLFGILIRAL